MNAANSQAFKGGGQLEDILDNKYRTKICQKSMKTRANKAYKDFYIKFQGLPKWCKKKSYSMF